MRQQQREEERRQRADAAAAKAVERELRQQHVAASKENAEWLTAELDRRVEQLGSILRSGLVRSAAIDLAGLLRSNELPPLDLGGRAGPVPQPDWAAFRPTEPGAVASLFGGRGRHRLRIADAEREFERAKRERDDAELQRQQWVGEQRAAYQIQLEAHQAEAEAHNRAVASLRDGCRKRERDSVERYLGMVLAAVQLPPDFPRTAELGYSPHGEQVVARVELPATDVVPPVARYQYVATKDEQRPVARPRAQTAQLYRSVVSQVVLLHIRDLFDADRALDAIDLRGHVHATNPATGQREYPCLVSVTVDRHAFAEINLVEVEPEVCLRHLNALVSAHPFRLEPVTPIRDFDLTRYAFVEGLDAVSGLDASPDLLNMTPTEFEHFVRQLFESMGMEGWTTERTGDDGIDAVVLNRDPIIGGLTVVQVKKYSRVLGVSHIRELVGAMDEKRAGRGVLVTTSWFTSGCWIKAKENGRIELIDGARLTHLIKEHLGRDVLIGIPGARGDRRP